jgi:hypothetical protein
MSYKTRSKKRAMRRQQKQARAANSRIDEFFRKREAWRRVQGRRAAARRRQPGGLVEPAPKQP